MLSFNSLGFERGRPVKLYEFWELQSERGHCISYQKSDFPIVDSVSTT